MYVMYTTWYRDSAFPLWYKSATLYANRADAARAVVNASGMFYLEGAYRNVHGGAVLRANMTDKEARARLEDLT